MTPNATIFLTKQQQGPWIGDAKVPVGYQGVTQVRP